MATLMDNFEFHTPQHWNQDKAKALIIEMKNKKKSMYNVHEVLNFKSLTYYHCSPGSVNIPFFVGWVSLNLISDQINGSSVYLQEVQVDKANGFIFIWDTCKKDAVNLNTMSS